MKKSKWLRKTKTVTASACIGLLALALADGQRPLRAQLIEAFGQATGTSYSGQATVVDITDTHNFPSPIVICDTGPLPSSGGTLQVTVLETNVDNGALTLENADAITTGDGAQAISDTSVANFQLQIMALDGTVTTLTADVIMSEAAATCKQNGNVTLTSSVLVEGLALNGAAIAVTGQANQTVYFHGGHLVINERSSFMSGSTGDVSVKAIHVLVDGCMNGIIGFAHADITCGSSGPPPSTECGKLTGGGWITGTPSGAKGTFAVSGGIRFGQFWGHLNYIDHGTGMHVKSTGVTGFTTDPSDSDCRDISYNVTIDGMPGTAYVIACDNGEPGRNDTFDITLSNGYHASGDLGGSQPGGGNIQLHKCPPGWLKSH